MDSQTPPSLAVSKQRHNKRTLLNAKPMPIEPNEDDSGVEVDSVVAASSDPAVVAAATSAASSTSSFSSSSVRSRTAGAPPATADTSAVTAVAAPSALSARAAHLGADRRRGAGRGGGGGGEGADAGDPDNNGDNGGLSAELLLLGLLLVLFFGTGIAFLFQAFVRSSGSSSHSSRFMSGGGGGDRRMQDTSFRLLVPLETLARGETVSCEVLGGRQRRCEFCGGHGAEGGQAGVHTCPACQGAGRTHTRRQVAPGFFQDIASVCHRCAGRGKVVTSRPCPHCAGQGLVRSEEPLQVSLPRSAPEGWTITIPRAGDEPSVDQMTQGVRNGDVRITLQSQPHATFTRRAATAAAGSPLLLEGQHLDTELSITLREALLGFSRTLTSLDGSELIEVSSGPEGGAVTRPGQVIILKGKGMPAFDGVAAAQLNEAQGGNAAEGGSILERASNAANQVWKQLGRESAAVAAGRKQSTPAGDLYVTIKVLWPKAPLTAQQAKELRTLLGD